MLNKILSTINKYNLIQKGDKIVIGVSGGPDSMCLLDSLYCLKDKLNIEIIVAHINHKIRKEADEETEYVKDYCKNKNIKCYVKKAEVEKLAKEQKLGTEEMGRKIRYDFFKEVAKKENANKIATAHNLNDNVETVMLNLLRGTGISGLKGIEIKRTEDNLEYIRPIRECERKDIEKYCEEQNLNPRIDKTNFENIYNRNKVRNELIPFLKKEFNPNILEGINRLSDLAREEEEYFEEKNILKDEVIDDVEEKIEEGTENVEDFENEIINDNEKIYVYITGEVNNPGIVVLPIGSRIVDAIDCAGGITQKADIMKVNLVYMLQDGMKVNIPSSIELKNNPNFEYITMSSGDEKNDSNIKKATTVDTKSESAFKVSNVNINTATQTELETLPGIGPSLALKIINYRKENGKFKSIEELKSVNGIGENKYEEIKKYIYV